ncbi:MAG: hypothetical protein AB1938_05105 [Myxococcota bacterium]
MLTHWPLSEQSLQQVLKHLQGMSGPGLPQDELAPLFRQQVVP